MSEYKNIFECKGDPEFYKGFSEAFDDILWSIKGFFWNVKRMIKWFPVIWKDRDNDWLYVIDILGFKLERLKNGIDGKFVGSDECVSDINEILGAIKRVQNSDYCKEEWDSYYKRYPLLLEKPISEIESKKEALEESKVIFEKEDMFINQDICSICDKLKNMRRWWV